MATDTQVHGRSAYSNGYCRCDVCKEANAKYAREQRASNLSEHREYHAKYMRDWMRRLKTDPNRREEYSEFKRRVKVAADKGRDKLKEETLRAYGNACACCGETRKYFLTLDHINGDGASSRKLTGLRGYNFYRKLRQDGFPSGYQILCANCNFAKGTKQSCPCGGK